MTELFADAFYFIALLNPFDQYHQAAVTASRQLTSRLSTTHWILIEVADALGSPCVRQRVAPFLNRIAADPNIMITPPDPDLFDRGLDLYARRPDKAWSLTDCISFVVMAERGLIDALTGDRHFEQAGFQALLRP